MHKTYFFLSILISLSDLSLGGYNMNKNPSPATTNPILSKWLQFCVGVIPSEPSPTPHFKNIEDISVQAWIIQRFLVHYQILQLFNIAIAILDFSLFFL